MKKNVVVVIEDDFEFAQMQASKINELDEFICSEIYTSAIDYLRECQANEDIVLLDLILPDLQGIDAIPYIIEKNSQVSIVINSSKDDTHTILRALQEGAVGYIDKQNFNYYYKMVLESVVSHGGYMTPKIARKIVESIQNKGHNLKILTKREKEVAEAITKGLSYKLVADELCISIDTVRMNIRNIYKKYKIHSRTELIGVIKNL